MNQILLLHLFCCFSMTGIIWLVQLLVYPNFKRYPAENFSDFHSFHSNRITYIVGPIMLLELITALWLFYERPEWIFKTNLVLLLIIWLATAFVSVPLHNRLEKNSYDLNIIEKLIRTNFIRTFIWSARSALFIAGSLQ